MAFSEMERTEPDCVVYDPREGNAPAWDNETFFWLNEQILMVRAPGGHLLATWTAERLDPHVLRIGCCRSFDEGQTWTPPQWIAGDGCVPNATAAWQVPVVSPGGRIYLFYNCNGSALAGGFCGGLRCAVSEDGGAVWSDPVDLAFPSSPIDSPEKAAPSMWISVAAPLYLPGGRALLGFTRWANNPAFPNGQSGIKERYSQAEFLRFENLRESPEAAAVQLTGLNVENPLCVPNPDAPTASFAQEPYTVALPDGRLFTLLRTNLGQVHYALSCDDGATWSVPEALGHEDDGEAIQQPVSPCPLFDVGNGRYLLLFNKNDGYVFGAESRWDVRNRRPAYLALGEFRPQAKQAIWFGDPVLFIDNGGVPWGPPGMGRLEAAAYPSLTPDPEGHMLWYPDRKGFLLGKRISQDYVRTLPPPR